MSSFSRRSSPARAPSARPLSVRVTSTHPVNRFFWFHSLSPWRSRMRLYVMAPFSHDPAREWPATATLTIRHAISNGNTYSTGGAERVAYGHASRPTSPALREHHRRSARRPHVDQLLPAPSHPHAPPPRAR